MAPQRGLRYGEYLIGIEGLALLRLYDGEDASQADACLEEMRRVLSDLDRPDYAREIRGPRLDVVPAYARWAHVYDLPGNPLIAHEEPIVREMLDENPGEPVLDAGCGTGRHLAYLSSQGRRTIGVDASVEMLEKARANVPDAELRRGDLLELPVQDAEVAGAVCSLALDHVADLPRAFAELARVVARGGWVIASTMHPAIAMMAGWGAWFVDSAGRADVVKFSQPVSAYLNAALDAGLHVRRCVEPSIDRANAARFAFPENAVGGTIALTGAPIVLIWLFAR